MAKFYVTFMFKQADNPPPQFPQAHPDAWLEVEAADELAARVLVTKTIGRQWAFIYDQRPDEPHIWLSVGDDLSGTAHLTLDQAREVARQLVWLADHHYQVSNA
jgi:hypothetical protein